MIRATTVAVATALLVVGWCSPAQTLTRGESGDFHPNVQLDTSQVLLIPTKESR